MGQNSFAAPILGAVCGSALGLLIVVAPCQSQQLQQPPSVRASADELPDPSPAEQDVLDMDLDQLSRADVVVPAMDTVVSTVSRQESTVGRSPAAVFVITPEMIRRSGATNIPDLLRMVPGIEVARIDANKWAITSRGFNNRFANKLLVQIDGRSVYTQAFSGVFWDEQDVVLQDVERIEVIRGPGATVWGANAVNGVINIITKQAKDTQGLLLSGGTGTEERGFSTVRYGDRTGNDLHWRIYGKQFERDGGYSPGPEFDDWRQGRGGFRADWTPSNCDTLTLQGDIYESTLGTGAAEFSLTPPFPITPRFYDTNVRGQNGLMRWTHVIDDESDWSIQAYYDNVERIDQNIEDGQEKFDVDFQYRFPLNQWHELICGAGYRHTNDRLLFHQPGASVIPPRRSTDLYSCFLQDQITLEEDRWYLIGGSKFEHNDFSGFEYQPSIRLLHLPSERASVWAAVSRAVRTPSRGDHGNDFVFPISPLGPTYIQLSGDDSVVAEELLAFEVGYRAQPTDDFSWDLALFYNNYENLVGVAPGGAPFFDFGLGGVVIPLVFANTLSADTYGAELASTFRVNPDWELTGSYSLLYMDVHAPAGDLTEGSSPTNHFYLRSSWNLRPDWELDVIGRYVDHLPALGVSSYVTMDVRMAWRPYKNLEWAVVARNLLDNHRSEFTDALLGTIGTEVQPELFTMLTWTY